MKEHNISENLPHNEQPELEKIRQITSWTIPSVEVLQVVAKKQRSLQPLEPAEALSLIAEAAVIKAANQHRLGLNSGFYPEEADKEEIRRKHRPKPIGNISLAIASTFPESGKVKNFLAEVASIDGNPVLTGGVAVSVSLGRELFSRTFAGIQPFGEVRLDLNHHLPVFSCSSRQDFNALRPYHFVAVPESAEAFSFTITKYSKPVRKGVFGSHPVVVTMNQTAPRIIEQHILSQLVYATVSQPEKATPVLVSKQESAYGKTYEEKINDWLDKKIKDYLITLILTSKKAIDWTKTENDPEKEETNIKKTLDAERLIYSMNRLLITKGSVLYIGDQLGVRETLSNKAIDEVSHLAEGKMWEGMKVAQEIVNDSPSVEYQLAVANFLAFFPLSQWGGGNTLRSIFGIPNPHRKMKNG